MDNVFLLVGTNAPDSTEKKESDLRRTLCLTNMGLV